MCAVTIAFAISMADTAAPATALRPGLPRANLQPANFDFCQRLLGDWAWVTDTPGGTVDGVLSFEDNHRVSATPRKGEKPVLVGTWSCKSTGHIIIRWQNTVEEYLDMSADSRSVTGKNSLGMPVRGRPF